jgi:hypothetical protein
MRRLISVGMVMLAILVGLVVPATGAEAKWVTASSREYGDPVVCRDAMSLGVGIQHESTVDYALLDITVVVSPTNEVIISSTMTVYKASPIFTTDEGSDLGLIGFPMLKWPRLLLPGTDVIIKDRTSDSQKVTVQNCLFYLDSFQRLGPSPGANWSGSVSGYTINTNKLRVGTGGPLYWKGSSFGVDQEAWVQIDGSGSEQGLLLKVQSRADGTLDWHAGAIKVDYRPKGSASEGISATIPRIVVATYTPATGAWSVVAKVLVGSLPHGDVLQARVVNNELYVIRSSAPLPTTGTEVVRNTKLLGRFPIDSFFANRIGPIGLWFQGATGAIIGSFGGGSIDPNQPKSCGSLPICR